MHKCTNPHPDTHAQMHLEYKTATDREPLVHPHARVHKPTPTPTHLRQARAGIHHNGQFTVLACVQQGLLQRSSLAGSRILKASAVEHHATALVLYILGNYDLCVRACIVC